MLAAVNGTVLLYEGHQGSSQLIPSAKGRGLKVRQGTRINW